MPDLPSGKFVLRIPPELHQRISELARKRRTSLNRFCVDTLADATRGPMRPESPSSELVGRIRALAGDSLEGVVLFGSTARGEARGDSDVDLLIVLSAVSTLRRDLYRQWDAQFGDATPALSPQFVRLPSGAEGAGGIWYEAAIDGVVLWDKAGAVAGRLRDLRKAIAEGRMRRRYLHGHPYWVREAGDLDEKSRAR